MWIKNYKKLGTTKQRQDALNIAESGLDAIDTENIIKNFIKLDQDHLHIKDQVFDLTKFKTIRVLGFGKASCKASYALEKIIGNKIKEGVAIGLAPTSCEYIKNYQGSHPLPSQENVAISKHIMEMGKESTKDDLVIVIVSGGGSALLCWPSDECDQGQQLYEQFLKTGGTVRELNTLRKHISLLKGGGLAKILYPATVIGLIFSDIPGDNYDLIASGPTYKDNTTIADAQKIIKKYKLDKFKLIETPKEDKYFEKINNIQLVSNQAALIAMKQTAEKLGYNSHILTDEMYDDVKKVLPRLTENLNNKSAIIAGGEPSLVVTKSRGTGGRNLYLAMQAIKFIEDEDTALFLASDGLDNSKVAGAIVDKDIKNKAQQMNLDIDDYIARFDGLGLGERLDNLLLTGPTEANVSDLMLILRK
ncbi:MAG: DUF4147 domain-containing protein [bacterium]|nr:DUF4147 domain-containing protein [bacterium]